MLTRLCRCFPLPHYLGVLYARTDLDSWSEVEEQYGVGPFPGLEMRKVDMAPYNQKQKVLDRIQLHYYRAIGPTPSVKKDPALHAAGHLYASDRNGLFTVRLMPVVCIMTKTDCEQIPNFLEAGDAYSSMASLSHTVVLHGGAADYDMLDKDGNPKWFCIEAAIEHISHGRSMVTGRLWDLEKKAPVATYIQDGLVRMKEGVRQSLDGESVIFGTPRGADTMDKKIEKLEKL